MRSKKAVSALTALLMTISCISSVPVTAEDTGTAAEENIAEENTAEEAAEELPEADEEDKYAKIEYDEDNSTITKEIDGYFYELTDFKEPWATLPVEHTPYLIPKEDGTFYADLSFEYSAGAAVGKRYGDAEDILDHNYWISFKYEKDESANEIQGGLSNNIRIAAWAELHDPDVSIRFYDMAESAYETCHFSYYAGTVILDGEKYIVEREKYNGSSAFTYFHICSDEAMESKVREFTYPVSDLIKASKDLGLDAGKLYEISVKTDNVRSTGWVDVLKNDIYEEDFSLLDKDGAFELYADMHRTAITPAEIDKYDFYSQNYYLDCGSSMTAYNNGRFTLESVDPQEELEDSAFDFGSCFDVDRTFMKKMKVRKETNIDYSIKDGLNGSYGIVFDVEVPELDKRNEVRYYLDVVEKLSDIDAEDFFKSYQIQYNIKQTVLNSVDLIKSYTSNGHEYDLYKCCYTHYGFGSDIYGAKYDQIRYFAVRKDCNDDEVFADHVNLYDHYSEISDFENIEGKLQKVRLNLHICKAEGSFEAERFELRYQDRNAADIIKGDFNNDKRVDSMDVITARAALVQQIDGGEFEGSEYSDININNEFDIGDVLLLQSYVIGRITEWPQKD